MLGHLFTLWGEGDRLIEYRPMVEGVKLLNEYKSKNMKKLAD